MRLIQRFRTGRLLSRVSSGRTTVERYEVVASVEIDRVRDEGEETSEMKPAALPVRVSRWMKQCDHASYPQSRGDYQIVTAYKSVFGNVCIAASCKGAHCDGSRVVYISYAQWVAPKAAGRLCCGVCLRGSKKP